MSKEEKAKEYADDIIENCQLDSPWNCEEIHWQLRDAYQSGYTQSEQDLSSQLTAYIEALRELWYDIHFTDISKEQIMDRIGSLIQPKP